MSPLVPKVSEYTSKHSDSFLLAMYLNSPSPPLHLSTPRAEQQQEECGFQGEPDLYGLGNRLGIYTQWLSALTIVVFRLRGDKGLRQAYVMFLFAVFVAVLVITARREVRWFPPVVFEPLGHLTRLGSCSRKGRWTVAVGGDVVALYPCTICLFFPFEC